ncbi:DUF2384 domain-containing protein [Candidimonas sp. SYP-B2681]|nr:DUF2384 domain-containing protein [Candidimonas sp. SYP-B2681]
MTESQRVSSIKAGLQTIWADAIKNAFEVSSPNMLVLMNLSSSTLERRRKSAQPLDLVASERLDRIASVALMAEGVFEDQEAAARWMSSSNVALGGDAPVMLCETELGARQVRRVLNALEWGGVV